MASLIYDYGGVLAISSGYWIRLLYDMKNAYQEDNSHHPLSA